ncbi:hypothetical protein F4680DRAFT_236900 [Xylaria scruposa]|nr:hypothetical protein F4680DRAFT_236900 [Xylaria scruposa]
MNKGEAKEGGKNKFRSRLSEQKIGLAFGFTCVCSLFSAQLDGERKIRYNSLKTLQRDSIMWYPLDVIKMFQPTIIPTHIIYLRACETQKLINDMQLSPSSPKISCPTPTSPSISPRHSSFIYVTHMLSSFVCACLRSSLVSRVFVVAERGGLAAYTPGQTLLSIMRTNAETRSAS